MWILIIILIHCAVIYVIIFKHEFKLNFWSFWRKADQAPRHPALPIVLQWPERNTDHKANMATCMSVVVKGTALTVLKPVLRLCSRQRTRVFIPHRFSHGARSSLYEHVREGYSDKPELDMRALCEETDKVIANVENRKGDLRGDDVRKIVSGLLIQPCLWHGSLSSVENTSLQLAAGCVAKQNIGQLRDFREIIT